MNEERMVKERDGKPKAAQAGASATASAQAKSK
jgi:hypothetical protein